MDGGYGPETYGDRWADVYDEWYGGEGDVDATVARLVAPGGRGSGARARSRHRSPGDPVGRNAGCEVVALDASAAMLDRLRAKPGGDAVSTVVGDMADVEVGGTFAVVFVAFNTFFNLTTQADQERCFRNIAGVLEPGGALVLEAFVPDASRVPPAQAVEARSVSPDRVVLQATRHDTAAQRVDMTTIVITEAGIRLLPLQARYASPAELDEMARHAGLECTERWADWRGTVFTPTSSEHVSVYRPSPQ